MSDTHVLAGLERRREDYPLITGQAHYVDDSALPAFGLGTFGSRTLQTAGSAVHLAAEAIR